MCLGIHSIIEWTKKGGDQLEGNGNKFSQKEELGNNDGNNN
jgi:hypothetical protein